MSLALIDSKDKLLILSYQIIKSKGSRLELNEIWGTKHVACISEILRFKAEPKYENGYDDYIKHMLDVSNWENGYD